jgi:hypothetical protein
MLVLASLLWALPGQPVVDELVHFAQAQAFARGEWEINPELSTWPTTNLMAAAMLYIFGADSLLAARVMIAGFALLAAIGFFLLAAHFDRPSASLKTAQFFLLPIVLPYCGLVYTDIPALAAVLWMFYGAVRQRFTMFVTAGLLALAFRQTNIVWSVSAIVLYAYELLRGSANGSGRRLVPLGIYAAIVAVAWVLIIWHQGGIAMTPQTQFSHVVGVRGIPNIEFALALGGILFFPVLASTGPMVLTALRNRAQQLLFVGIVLFVGFTFVATHPYNMDPSVLDGFLRNRFIFLITHTPLLWAFSVLVAIAIFAFGSVEFVPRAASFKLPLYAIGILALLPLHLIEQRYYVTLYALFWILRSPVDYRVERLQLAANVTLSIAVLVAIARLQIFI